MKGSVCIWAVLSATPMLASERMTVSVCTEGRLSEKVAVGAEVEAAALFHLMDIEIVWAKCEAGLEGDAAAQEHWFTIRLRDGRPFVAPGLLDDTLGEAFLSDDQTGYIADVYYEAGEALASSKQIKLAALLGCVMAHELGHLLLGPGHAPHGIMRAAWDLEDLAAIGRGWLKFNRAEGARIRQVLQDSVVALPPIDVRAVRRLQVVLKPGS